MNSKKILAINLGSTSTKIAYFEGAICRFKESIRHDPAELKRFDSVFDQEEYRTSAILHWLKAHDVDPDKLDVIASRGGQTQPIPGGVYAINEAMLAQARSGEYGIHVCSVGCIIAYKLCLGRKAIPLTVDTPTTDEFAPIARISGLPEIERKSSFQALNQKAMARHYAELNGKQYENMNLVVAMLGGGISVVAHAHGRMIDGPNALDGDGPFSNNRCGTVPVGDLVRLCYSGKYTEEEMLFHVNGGAGLLAYLGTLDTMEIEQRIDAGDEKAKQILEAMCYQTAKEIGAYATVLKGEVDAILLIGGMANSRRITSQISERVSFIAPVIVLAGEREMEALALRSLRALCGDEEIRTFVPVR